MLNTSVRTLHREDELVRLLQCRQERGFRLLYRQYAANLYGIALRIVRCPATAEDVVQESVMKVWRNIDAYDPNRGRLFTWLLHIVRSTALDHCRSRSRLGFSELEELSGPSSEPGGNPHHALPVYLLAVDHIGVHTLLGRLTPEQKLVLEYLYFRGFTHAEAAQALCLPLGTVKTRVRLALIHLRELIREPGARRCPAPKALSPAPQA